MANGTSNITEGTPWTLDPNNGYSTDMGATANELLISTMSNFSSSPGKPTDSPHSPDAETSSDYTTEELIILIGTPLIVVPGIIGNVVSAVVMKRPHFRSISAGAHLFCLALVDSIFLSINSMTKNFMRLLINVDLTKTSTWSCKIYVFLLMTSKCLSAWLIVAVTMERLIVVCLPHRAKVLVTRRKAWLVILCVTLVACALHVIVLVTYGLVERPWGSDCTMMLHYRDLGLRLGLTIIDLTTYSLLPAVVLFVSNVILIYKVMRSSSFRKRSFRGASSPEATPQPVDDVTRLTVTLVTVSVTFLISTSPNSLMFLIKTVDESVTSEIPNYDLLYRSLYLLQLSNSAVNFLLYCLSGPAFRRELGRLCPCCCKAKSNGVKRNSTKKGIPSKAQKYLGMNNDVPNSRDSVSTVSAAGSTTVSLTM